MPYVRPYSSFFKAVLAYFWSGDALRAITSVAKKGIKIFMANGKATSVTKLLDSGTLSARE